MEYPKGILIPYKKEENTVIINKERLVDTHETSDVEFLISRRGGGEFKHHAFYLTSDFEWIITEDSEGFACLIPLRRTTK